jgi:hypothetical protein
MYLQPTLSYDVGRAALSAVRQPKVRALRRRVERRRVQRRKERHALWTLRLTTGRDWLGQVFGSRHPYRKVRRP